MSSKSDPSPEHDPGRAGLLAAWIVLGVFGGLRGLCL
jgi:hypothetical protein